VKALVVLASPPHPEGDAPSRCAVGLLQGLLSHGVDVRAIAARQHFAAGRAAEAPVPVEVVDVAPEPPVVARWNGLRRPLSELGRGLFDRRVRELAAEVDLVHLDQSVMAWSASRVPVPRLISLHYRARLDRGFGRPGSRQSRQVLEFVRLERAAVRRHRYLVATTPEVAATMPRRARPEPVVVSLTVDPHGYEPAPPPDRPTAGFIGTASWPPTAVERLTGSVWPAVRRAAPQAQLVVAGRGSREVPALHDVPGATLLGEVPSASGFLNQLSLLLYPVPRGSGMKVKVLESLACGVPVVTTRAGAEGFEPSEGIVVEQEPERLAAAAASILTDGDERHERALAARRLFDEHHRPHPATLPLVRLYRRMLADGGGSNR
jgi:glycosyltransferase involved in cell wall biosynthesis